VDASRDLGEGIGAVHELTVLAAAFLQYLGNDIGF